MPVIRDFKSHELEMAFPLAYPLLAFKEGRPVRRYWSDVVRRRREEEEEAQGVGILRTYACSIDADVAYR